MKPKGILSKGKQKEINFEIAAQSINFIQGNEQEVETVSTAKSRETNSVRIGSNESKSVRFSSPKKQTSIRSTASNCTTKSTQPSERVVTFEEENKATIQEENQFSAEGKITKADLAWLFNSARDQGAYVAYYEDGNPDLYTEENLAARENLKKDPLVSQAVQNFMKMYKQEKGGFSKETYQSIFSKCAQVLRPEITEEELRIILESD